MRNAPDYYANDRNAGEPVNLYFPVLLPKFRTLKQTTTLIPPPSLPRRGQISFSEHMGSLIILKLGNLTLDWAKNGVEPTTVRCFKPGMLNPCRTITSATKTNRSSK